MQSTKLRRHELFLSKLMPFTKISQHGWLPQLRGFICAYHPAAPGSNPKHTICAFLKKKISQQSISTILNVKQQFDVYRAYEGPVIKSSIKMLEEFYSSSVLFFVKNTVLQLFIIFHIRHTQSLAQRLFGASDQKVE